MIYIITPYLSDFKEVCRQNGWTPNIVNGHPKDQNIQWIFNLSQIEGKRFFKVDIIIFGSKCDQFDPKVFDRIYKEIELRKTTF